MAGLYTYTYYVNLDLVQNQLQNVVLHPLDTPPSSPSGGQVYFDTTLNTPRYWSSSSGLWYSMSSAVSSTNFGLVGAGTNTSTALYVGSGSVLYPTGQGIISANRFNNNTVVAIADGGTNRSGFIDNRVFLSSGGQIFFTPDFNHSTTSGLLTVGIGPSSSGYNARLSINAPSGFAHFRLEPRGLRVNSPGDNTFEYDGTSLYYTDAFSVRQRFAVSGESFLTAFNGTVPVSRGGTNVTSLASNAIIVSNAAATSLTGYAATSVSGGVLISNGSTWGYSSGYLKIANAPSSISSGSIPYYNGSGWVTSSLSSANVSGFNQSVEDVVSVFLMNGTGISTVYDGAFLQLNFNGALNDCSDVTTASASSGQALVYNGSTWLAGSVASSGGGGGGAPTGASYLVVATDPILSNDRALIFNGPFTANDGGGKSNYTVGVSGNGITDAHFRQSAALSIVGRSANSVGNVGDISASVDYTVLSRSGTSVGFNKIFTNTILDSAVTYAKVQNVTKETLLGRAVNTDGVVTEIALGTGLAFSAGLLFALPDVSVTQNINFSIYGTPNVPISTGIKGYQRICYTGYIQGYYAITDTTGYLQVDVLKVPFSSYMAASSITSGNYIVVSGTFSNSSLTLTDWNRYITTNDLLAFDIKSINSSVKRLQIFLDVKRI